MASQNPVNPVTEGLASDAEDLLKGYEPMPATPAAMAGDQAKGKKKRKNTVKLSEEETKRIVTSVVEVMSANKGNNANVRVQTPALFTGKRGSFAYFIGKVESYAKLTNVPETKWLALGVQHLEERPHKVWDAHVRKAAREGKELTWEDFKGFMEKRYDSTDLVTLARAKLDKVYQGNESVERYIERFMGLMSDVEVEYEMQEPDKIHLFVKGLSTPLRLASTINPGTGKPFTDLDDLCTFVVKYEAGLKSVPGDGQGREPKKGRPYLHQPQLGGVFGSQSNPYLEGQVTHTPFPLWGAAQAPGGGFGKGFGRGKVDSRAAVPADRECYFCHKLGHESWQCHAKKEYLAAKAKAAGLTPGHFQPGYYPAQPTGPPVAAPVQGVDPSSGPQVAGVVKGKGKGKGKKGKGKAHPSGV